MAAGPVVTGGVPAGAWPRHGRLRLPPYRIDLYQNPSSARRARLAPALTRVLHESFLNHPDYDRDNLAGMLSSDLFLEVRGERGDCGLFLADFEQADGTPLLYLAAGFLLPECRSGGALHRDMIRLALAAAAASFNQADFLVALRTANPRVIAQLWRMPYFRLYPRPDWSESDPLAARVAPLFCRAHFGADRCEPSGRLFRDIYPAPPWGGQIPWHHDEAVNRFWREHLSPAGRDALLLLGPTTPEGWDFPLEPTGWGVRALPD